MLRRESITSITVFLADPASAHCLKETNSGLQIAPRQRRE
jgi:hypothetical protein